MGPEIREETTWMLVPVLEAEVKWEVGGERSVFLTERVEFQLLRVGSPGGAV